MRQFLSSGYSRRILEILALDRFLSDSGRWESFSGSEAKGGRRPYQVHDDELGFAIPATGTIASDERLCLGSMMWEPTPVAFPEIQNVLPRVRSR